MKTLSVILITLGVLSIAFGMLMWTKDDLLASRKIYGEFTQMLTPHLSECGRCGVTWEFCISHSTQYEEGRGCFPLCEYCWSDMTVEERWPYYEELWLSWLYWDPTLDTKKFYAIRKAVMAGK